jgi:hypothetical protein
MHFVIPFAAPPVDAGPAALQGLALPALRALLARLALAARSSGDAYALSMPHERALAAALGWEGADGTLPWAARAAAADGLDTGDLAWGLLSPVHWQVGREHLTMGDPDALDLDAAESRAFVDALRPLFESEGWLLAWGAPTRWYLAHESLATLPTASPERVIGRNPDLWLPDHPHAKPLKRLVSEVQMLLHSHPLNAAREADGRDPLNSVWLSGCGPRQPDRAPAPQVLDALRAPALRGDLDGWRAAWQALDAGALSAALAQAEPPTLTLCGERDAQTFEPRARGWWTALRARFASPDPAALLAGL